ncbi:DNA-processing protein DprA [Phytohalomonas tamaricis]|uniref:DNA-processing protein DprA n=1 Tax=Phytohalomonas tamaricis TaxID=2081032 RepID=UPI0021D41398|nr:DNA-processing protein DprA [Phytohalomonas tamaricis]
MTSTAVMTARDWLALSLLPRLGTRRLFELRRQRLPWPEGWLAALPAEPQRVLRGYLKAPEKSVLHKSIAAGLAWCEANANHHLLYPGHPHWPRLLDELPDPPAVLWGWGALDCLEVPALAMVGTRRPTREGLDNAAMFSRALVASGYSVISGMALGIDGQAHASALDAGGRTVAVLGCGADVLYPRQHRDLRRRLLESGGLILSEHPPGTSAHPRHFPRRNRLITGLSRGVLVVEAALKSGSLVSARLAMEQNRDVFALPGSIHNPQATGCLWLIQEGARLVTKIDDILVELPPLNDEAMAAYDMASPDESLGEATSLFASITDAQAKTAEPIYADYADDDPLLRLLGGQPTPLDTLVELSGIDVTQCSTQLLMLELEGKVMQAPGGWVRVSGEIR